MHSGHIAYLEAARQLGDILVVGVNSDAWLERKKGRAFMPLLERTTILRSLRGVDFGALSFTQVGGDTLLRVNDTEVGHFVNLSVTALNNQANFALA